MVFPWPLLVPFFLCWGSFLNVLAYRLIEEKNLFKPSACPSCNIPIRWYDNIPIVSWLLLHGSCRSCKKPISWLYPFIEFLTAFLFTVLYITNDHFLGYAFFFSALIVTVRSDLESMLVSRYMTLALIPFGIAFSFLDIIPIFPLDSVFGALFGYGFLWIIARSFAYFAKREGMGQGDLDLIAFIGSFTGIVGVWSSLLLGSVLGSMCGILYLLYIGKMARHTKIPFGPFLAISAMLYVFFQELITTSLIG